MLIKSQVELKRFRSFVRTIAGSRPPANHHLEQFHMTAKSLANQFLALRSYFVGQRVIVLGDDDHLSLLIAKYTDAYVTALELDERICASLKMWAEKLSLKNLTVKKQDVRDCHARSRGKFDVFYANPPFSSKNQGHGMRAWVNAGITWCKPRCVGIIAMPSNHFETGWINRNWISMQAYLTHNGFRIERLSEHRSAYAGTTQPGLLSCNLVGRRVDPTMRLVEKPSEGSRLYR